MTTEVKIVAHVSDLKEVAVTILDGDTVVEDFVLTDGEKADRYVHDKRVILIKERLREIENTQEQPSAA